MKENVLDPVELTANQRRIFVDICQLHEAYEDACRRSESFKGSMRWKKSKGREYLFKQLDRRGNGKSLGPRSEETEGILAGFQKGKAETKDRLASVKKRLDEQARFCKAAGIQRVPTVVARILRVLEKFKVLGNRLMIMGTNALYAYEALAGVFFDSPIMATEDLDIVFDARSGVTLTGEGGEAMGLLDILKKADRSFSLMEEGNFRAVNRDGYMVDLIRPMPSPPWKDQPRSVGGADDMQAVDTRKLDWMVSSPKLSQVVIGNDGLPARIVVPDPRAFIVHKLWLSRQEDRQPVKKPRDRQQGVAVMKLIRRYLPQYEFTPSELKMFPKDVVELVDYFL